MIGVDDFLQRGGTDRTEVEVAIRTHLGLAENDILLAAGSLAEGLGTIKSDLDIFLITDRDAADETGDEVILSVRKCMVDVRILPKRRIAALLVRLGEWARAGWDPSNVGPFNHDERVLLHRLVQGQVWTTGYGSDPASGFRPELEQVSRLKLHVARHAAKAIQVDLEGYRDLGDYRSMAFAAQKLLGHAIDGLLAAHRQTNPISKWRSRLLAELPATWQAPLLRREAEQWAPDLYWRLHRFPERASAEVISSVDRILAFSRTIFLWAEASLLGLPVLTRGPASFSGQGPRTGAPLPPLFADVDFVLTPSGAAAARLNEFGPALSLETDDVATALLFDGVTTRTEAILAIEANDPTITVAGARVDALAARLAAARLCRAIELPDDDAGRTERRSPVWAV